MTDDSSSPETSGDTGTPRWVKLFALLFILVVILLVVAMLTGSHGPGVHTS